MFRCIYSAQKFWPKHSNIQMHSDAPNTQYEPSNPKITPQNYESNPTHEWTWFAKMLIWTKEVHNQRFKTIYNPQNAEQKVQKYKNEDSVKSIMPKKMLNRTFK